MGGSKMGPAQHAGNEGAADGRACRIRSVDLTIRKWQREERAIANKPPGSPEVPAGLSGCLAASLPASTATAARAWQLGSARQAPAFLHLHFETSESNIAEEEERGEQEQQQQEECSLLPNEPAGFWPTDDSPAPNGPTRL
jgi:hypothetical protein